MPPVFITVHLTEPGGKGGRLLPCVQVGDIAYPQGAEGGNALLALFGYNFCHRGGSQGHAVPEDKGGHVPQVG